MVGILAIIPGLCPRPRVYGAEAPIAKALALTPAIP